MERARAAPAAAGPPASRLARLAIAAVAGTLLAPVPAQAEFRVCNQTLNLFNLAVGRFVKEVQSFATEGWWTLAANSCTSPIKQPLESQYVYLYGTDIYGDEAIAGTTEMCVGAKQFEIQGIDDCWVRGFQRVRFLEVDTRNAPRWTVFIRDR